MSYYQTMYGTDDVNAQFPIERIAKINGFTRDNGPIIELGGELIRCKDCKYYRDGDCWREWENDGQSVILSIINEPYPDDYCSRAERKEE